MDFRPLILEVRNVLLSTTSFVTTIRMSILLQRPPELYRSLLVLNVHLYVLLSQHGSHQLLILGFLSAHHITRLLVAILGYFFSLFAHIDSVCGVNHT